MPGSILKFVSLQSRVDLSFWGELGSRKLDLYRLSEDAVEVKAYLSSSSRQEISSPLYLDNTSFDVSGASSPSGSHPVLGALLNFNTKEAFSAADKAAALKKVAGQIWEDIRSGAALQQPALLSRFLLLTFADLKQFHFHYWFAFPSLKPPTPFSVTAAASAQEALGAEAAQQVLAACDHWRAIRPPRTPLDPPEPPPGPASPPFWLIRRGDGTSPPEALPLSSWPELAAAGQLPLLAMSDPSHMAEHPGWPLRNLLLLASYHFKVSEVQVLCMRDSRGRADASRSLLLTVQLTDLPEDWPAGGIAPAAVGWEANARGVLASRMVDLGPVMDPVQLAAQAVDLNLKLMRWRAAPELDIEALAATRCLLLGAGTLGCAVARTLLAWGVRRITFCDSSRVSFSNPVRQSLFDFEDCLGGGRPKAEAAAEKLRKILPVAEAQGLQLQIPMPGHPPPTDAAAQQMQQAAEQLQQLVSEHDVVFLLTDTRESRWLPSLLCAAAGKLAITAALGFDTYVVMRHGGPPSPPPNPTPAPPTPTPSTSIHTPTPSSAATPEPTSTAAPSAAAPAPTPTSPHPPPARPPRLGCYFCNDVVAPLNSTVDRTLDQQCTVARPGLAPIAAAQAVELMAAVLQHPLGVHCPTGGGGAAPALGPPPHMIRGTLAGFQQSAMEGQAFQQCTACSAVVVEQYKQHGWSFLESAIREPKSLEELTGLAALHEQAASMLAVLDDEDDEAALGGGEGGGVGVDHACDSEDEWTSL